MKTNLFLQMILMSTLILLTSCAPKAQSESADTEPVEVPATQEIASIEEPQEIEVTEAVEEAPAPTPEPTEIAITHLMMPGELPVASASHASDPTCASSSTQKRAFGGDRVSQNSYERPFNAFEMNVYYPFLDIVFSEIYQDADWICLRDS